jgi:hypothetical protein
MSLLETPSLVYLTAYSEIFFSVFGPISMIIIIIWHGGETKMKRK